MKVRIYAEENEIVRSGNKFVVSSGQRHLIVVDASPGRWVTCSFFNSLGRLTLLPPTEHTGQKPSEQFVFQLVTPKWEGLGMLDFIETPQRLFDPDEMAKIVHPSQLIETLARSLSSLKKCGVGLATGACLPQAF